MGLTDDILREARDIASDWYTLMGGPNSRLRQRQTVHLGHPFLPEAENMKVVVNDVEKCWVHPERGGYPTPDTEDDGREYIPGEPFTAILPPSVEKALEPLKLGDPVWIEMIENHLTITGSAGEAAVIWNQGAKGVGQAAPVERQQLDWLLISPQSPPSRGVILRGGLVRNGNSVVRLPPLEIPDIITAHETGLSAGQARAVLVTQDTTNPTFAGITMTASDPFTDNRASNGISDHAALFANYPTTIPEDHIAYGYVKVYRDMETVQVMDIYPALDPGGGSGGGGGAEALGDLTDVAISSPLEGHVLYYDGSGWVNRYNWDGFYLEGPNNITSIPANDNGSLDFLINYDSGGFYNEGANEATLTVGVWDVKALLRFSFASAPSAGKVHLQIGGTFAGSSNPSHGQTIFIPAGVTGSIDLQVSAPGGFIGSSEIFGVSVTNACDQQLDIDYCSFSADRRRP